MGAKSLAVITLASTLFAGCAGPGATRSALEHDAHQVVLYARLDDATRAATTALAEKRLGSNTVERTEKGALVRGDLSGLTGAVYNSHGGRGSVSIDQEYPGGTRLSISAGTSSRLGHEPVGAMDALKGYNYNDPKYAVEIIQRMRELLPQVDVDRLRAEDERARVAYHDELNRKLAEEKRRADEFSALLDEAARGSRVACATEAECRKAFSLAQIFVSTKTDMKIQLATDTIIETYNPTEVGRMGAKVIKTPGAAQSAEIVITVSCRECTSGLRKNSLELMRDFRPFVESRLRQ